MTDSAFLKIDRAAKHVVELNELFSKTRPFSFALETDTKTCKRSLFPKHNTAVINTAGIICGDVVHNLCSALDHVYWEIVSPRCSSDDEFRRLQFPFVEKANRLDGAIQQRLAQRAGTGFYCAIRSLKPHGESGGDELLYLIHEMNIIDKHKLLIPTADYITFSGDMIRQQVPDFNVISGSVLIGFTRCAFNWRVAQLPLDQLGRLKPPTTSIFERELDMPMDIVFSIGGKGRPRPVIPTLNALVDTARQTIRLIREASASC